MRGQAAARWQPACSMTLVGVWRRWALSACPGAMQVPPIVPHRSGCVHMGVQGVARRFWRPTCYGATQWRSRGSARMMHGAWALSSDLTSQRCARVCEVVVGEGRTPAPWYQVAFSLVCAYGLWLAIWFVCGVPGSTAAYRCCLRVSHAIMSQTGSMPALWNDVLPSPTAYTGSRPCQCQSSMRRPAGSAHPPQPAPMARDRPCVRAGPVHAPSCPSMPFPAPPWSTATGNSRSWRLTA